MLLHVMDHQDNDDEIHYVRGVNWALDSTDEDEDPMADSEVQFVMDTFAGKIEVPDSQMDIAEVNEPDTEVDEPDAVYALVKLASIDVNKFQSTR
uniref:Uncharacterized protein n=1 Tax=Setaria viridis TaxID=4556 RepID=A0A4V6D707_SETVI|nr:hypothetical protein SEVIR_5G301333v2 [Setaria viridis]